MGHIRHIVHYRIKLQQAFKGSSETIPGRRTVNFFCGGAVRVLAFVASIILYFVTIFIRKETKRIYYIVL